MHQQGSMRPAVKPSQHHKASNSVARLRIEHVQHQRLDWLAQIYERIRIYR